MIRIYGIDVTEQKNIEEGLNRHRARYRSLFNKISEGYAIGEVTDDQRGNPHDIRFLDVNPAFEEICGLPRLSVIGKTIRQVFPRATRELVAPYLRVAVMGKSAQFEQYISQSGRWYNVFLYKTAHRQLAGLFLDITQKKRAEEERNKFVSIVAHEMRNPLMSILASAQLLRDMIERGEPAGAARERLDVIERQARNMGKLLEDVLDTSRMSRQKIVLNKRVVDARESVRLAAAAASEVAGQKRQALSVTLPKRPVWLHADPLRLEQILGNLVNNAVKYTPEGGHIRVRVWERDKTAAISVRDNGQGISREKMRSIFKLFNRADSMPFSSIGSLGIGLNISKRLVLMHGGRIGVRSAGEGKGSAFTVMIPKARRAAKAELPAAAKARAKNAGAMRIMVVDDNRDIARLISDIFNDAGHEVLVSHDGLDAIEKAKAFMPQAAIIDIGLPGASGYQVAQAIRRQSAGGKVKLVALTGYGRENDRQKSRRAGFDLHLVKPVDVSQLTDLL